MKSQENIKNINVTGVSSGNSVKITLNGEGNIKFKYISRYFKRG